jgi:hypothetical protein
MLFIAFVCSRTGTYVMENAACATGPRNGFSLQENAVLSLRKIPLQDPAKGFRAYKPAPGGAISRFAHSRRLVTAEGPPDLSLKAAARFARLRSILYAVF